MKIEILQNIGKICTFSTAFGNGVGTVVGTKSNEPKIDVEIEIESVLQWGVDIVDTTSSSPRISFSDGITEINALVEFLHEDNLVSLRLGDSILSIEVDRLPEEICAGHWVLLKISDLQLFPTNI